MAYTKVELCGMNTTKIKVLSEKEKRELLQRIRAGDKNAREEMICGNLKLVLSVLQKFAGRGENQDDLFQVGVIGLMKAIDGFNLDLGLRFSTYAVPMIIGEIRRYLRDNSMIHVSRSLRDLAYRALQVKERLTARWKREPTVGEIAHEMKEPVIEIVTALDAVNDPMSLDEPIFNDSGDSFSVLDQVKDPVGSSDWLDTLAMRETVKHLPEREHRILVARFLQGQTQMEVAEEIGISQAQVSRLEKSAIARIKANWQE